MSDPVAKRDYARLHLALARRRLGMTVEIPELDGQQALLDEHDQELDDSVRCHPSGGDAA